MLVEPHHASRAYCRMRAGQEPEPIVPTMLCRARQNSAALRAAQSCRECIPQISEDPTSYRRPGGGTPCAARSASRCRNPPARTDQVPIRNIMSGYVPSSCLIRCFTATSRSWPASCHRLTCCIPLDKPEAFHRRRGTTTQTRRSFACSRTELWILVNESPDGRSGIDPSGLTGVARRRGRR